MSESTKRNPSPVILEATQRQRMASDPLVSSWVGASAGSGKTKVLTDRILRLLLPREDGRPGTKPQKILALTFTKAGANEMALRLSRRLSEWAVMDEAKLSGDMEENLFGRPPKPVELVAARKLFASVVDAPGGLNIMTIHSFCQSVLGRFPIEAGLPPHFKPLEEEQARELLDQARKCTLSNASTDASTPLHEAISYISTVMAEDQFLSLVQTIVKERSQLESILKRTFGTDGLYTKICAVLGIQPGLTEEEAFARFVENTDGPSLRHTCAALSNGKTTDQRKALAIQNFLDAKPSDRFYLYAEYYKNFISTKKEIKSLATKDVLAKHPDIETILLHEAERLLAYEEEKKAIACATSTRSLLQIGVAILERYQEEKNRRGVLDFDDLILKTLSLLKGEVRNLDGLKVTPWILYKLDEGLDHILVDEAQDTNPEQWEIIRALSDDFFSGEGAAQDIRTLFVVGDKKQSIFSFQRAAPEKFDEMHRWFDKKIRESGGTFLPVDINTSFRSVRTILDAVDAVFVSERGFIGGYLDHIAKREGQAGLVELWPVYQTETPAESEQEDPAKDSHTGSWNIPDKLVESQSGSLKMASKIGDVIKNWIDQKTILESYDRPIRPGDILVLVRVRNAFVGQLVRALKIRKVPVSGVDRMILGDQIVVQDLAATAKFALLPDDDLTLACLLKSPFVGMSEDSLYVLAQNRSSTLWELIKKKGDGLIVNWLESLIARAGALSSYEFFSRLVQEPCPADKASGMRAIRTRLGDDALDPLDEFLNLAQTYDSNHSSGLQGFLHWHEQESSEIKRQMEEGGGSVRIMTVHGAKGLQAPIVFLPDTIRSAPSIKPDKILWPHKTGLDVPLHISSREAAPATARTSLSLIESQMDEEYRRLLYVAMTRAEERLYIGGYTGKRGPSQTGKVAYWYDDIRGALETHPDIVREDSGILDKNGNDMPILRLSTTRTATPDKATHNNEAPEHTTSLPDWAFRAAPSEPFPPRRLAPSRPSDLEPAAASPLGTSQAYRFKRGNITHKLLQILPELPSESRKAAAEKFLARPALGLPPDLQKSIASEVMAILNDQNFGAIFGPGSMAEIPVTGLIGSNTLVSGQIDRIVILEKEILIVDYKTNRPPPQKPEDVPNVYVRQMKTYADTLRMIYPGHTVRCALLWTDGPRLMEITV
jgi:ATP-dependent helicase/nuclease subunit A